MSLERDVEFIYELGALRFVDRTWKRFLNGDFANNAEHLFRVTWIALIIAKHEGVTNLERVMKMAIAHDIAESRTGDVDYLSRQYVTRDEAAGLADMVEGTALEAEIKEFIHEYEERTSIESKIVKDADNLDVDFELYEQATHGHDLSSRWKLMRKQVHEQKLFTETARKIAKSLEKSDPHSWHLNSPRNRINGGDWKK
jgi:putative hydrolase of HD superfamily